jgi:hypothetical protein
VREDCGGEGGDEGGGGAEAGFVGFGDGDAEVVEAGCFCGGGEVGGRGVVVVVGEDGDGRWGDDGVARGGGDIAEGVAEGCFDEGVVVEFEVCVSVKCKYECNEPYKMFDRFPNIAREMKTSILQMISSVCSARNVKAIQIHQMKKRNNSLTSAVASSAYPHRAQPACTHTPTPRSRTVATSQ